MNEKERVEAFVGEEVFFVGCEGCRFCTVNLSYPNNLITTGCLLDYRECLGDPESVNSREDLDYSHFEPVGENWITFTSHDMDSGDSISGWYNHETGQKIIMDIYCDAIPEKPLCFDCEPQVWCGDCPDDDRCDPRCSECDFSLECMEKEELQMDQFVGDFEPHVEEDIGPYDTDVPYENWGDSILEIINEARKQNPISDLMRGVPSEGLLTSTEVEHRYVEAVGIEAEQLDDGSWLIPSPKVEPLPEDDIDHPSHYAEAGIPSGIECWDHYELSMTEEEFAGAMKNNIYKYVFRAGRKGTENAVKDLEKAGAYLKRWIKYLEGRRIVWMEGKKAE
jgi:hypothetical protein